MKFCTEQRIEEIERYIEKYKKEILDDLTALVRIPSVQSEAKSGMPFGKACDEALSKSASLYMREGFETKINHDGGYCYSVFGNGKKSLGLFSHCDVVPVDDSWILCQPFSPILKDGSIVGRGCSDDKSGIIQTLYAAKIIKELNYP